MRAADMSGLTDEALVHRELQLERDLLELRFRLKTNQLENTSSITKIRKDIARIRTVQRQREIDQGLSSKALRAQHRSSFQPGTAAAEDGGAASTGFLKGIARKIGVGGDDCE